MENITTTPGALSRLLTTLIELRMACMIWGGPGIGKSDIIRQVSQALGMPMIDTRVSQLDQVDLRGIPSVDPVSHRTRWCTPEFFPDQGAGVWLFDEINSGSPSVQAALYQLINDRMLGEYTMPDEWRVVAAGNRESDGGVTYRMPSPLGNRFVHLHVQSDASDWVSWALSNAIDARVIAAVRSGYLATAGEKQESAVYHFDRASAAFLTPRSLAKCSRIIDAMPQDSTERHTLICGLIGQAHGNELTAFCRMCDDLPNVDVIRKDPKGAPLPKNPSVAYAVACAIGRTLDTSTIAADLAYLRRIKSSDGHELPEYRMLLAQDLRARIADFDKSAIVGHPEWRKEMLALAPFVVATR